MAGFDPRFLPQALLLWRRHRVQALLSALGIIAGITGLVLVIALGEGARRELEHALGTLGSGTLIIKRKPDGADQSALTTRHQETLSRLLAGQLRRQAPLRNANLAIASPEQQRQNIRVIATTRDYQQLYGLSLFQGRFVADYDVAHKARVCVLGWELGKALFPRGQVIGGEVRIGNHWHRVVGWLKPGAGDLSRLKALGLAEMDRQVYVPLSPMAGESGFLHAEGAALDELALEFPGETTVIQALGVVKRVIDRGRPAIERGRPSAAVDYILPIQLLRQKQRLQQVFQYVLLGVAGLMLVVGGIGIMNVMMVNVIARRPEIGLRLAVGATREDIVAQFITESLVITLIGGSAGLAAGFLLTQAIDALTGWPMAFSLEAGFAGLAASILTGIVFGTYPALQAASVSPVKSLNQI